MSESKSAMVTVEMLGKIMDELARKIGAMSPDDPRRRVLVDEISDLSHIRVWLRTETSKAVVEKVDKLARELARLKVGDRRRVEVMNRILSLMPSMKEH